MGQPDWAAIKSANATHSAMIAAWWSAISTTFALIFAAIAAWWARRAALEAAKQAAAAIESVEWSQKAAEAALAQTALVRKQLEYSEPQPIVVLTIEHEQSEDGRRLPVIVLRNVGQEPAFDVGTSDLLVEIKTPGKNLRKFAFQVEHLLLAGEAQRLRRTGVRLLYPKDYEWLSNLFESSNAAIGAALAARGDHFTPNDHITMSVQPMTVSYRNARGKTFNQSFFLREDGEVFMFVPKRSLVEAVGER
jgi:hypothetical protein